MAFVPGSDSCAVSVARAHGQVVMARSTGALAVLVSPQAGRRAPVCCSFTAKRRKSSSTADDSRARAVAFLTY
jgi:hypothetical protein